MGPLNHAHGQAQAEVAMSPSPSPYPGSHPSPGSEAERRAAVRVPLDYDPEGSARAPVRVAETPQTPHPSGSDVPRHGVAVDLTRRSGPHGVMVHGSYHQGWSLQEHRRRHGDEDVEIRFDSGDTGCVNVRLDGELVRLVRATEPPDGGAIDADHPGRRS